MRLNRLFRESSFKRGVRLHTPIDLPFEIPNYEWRLNYLIPINSVTRGPGHEVWHEVTNINTAIEDARAAKLTSLPANKFMMHTVFDGEKFKIIYDRLLLSKPETQEPTFHVDDEFNSEQYNEIVPVMETTITNQLIIYCLVTAFGKEYNVDFAPATRQKLEKLYKDTLNTINQHLQDAPY